MFLRCFFAWCVFGLSQVAGETPIYALVGKEAHLKTDIKTPPDDILWKHNGDKVVEFNGNMEDVFGSYKGRVSMDWHSAELTISDVTFEDSGQYDLETFTNKVLHQTQYNLEVIDEVNKPTISCEMKGNSSDESGHLATLTCSAESKQSQSLLKFTWSPDGQLGSKLIIPLGDKHDDQEYSCTVQNPLTEESATFIAKKCYHDETPSIPLIVGICVGCLLFLLIVGIILCLCCKARLKHEKTYDLEKQKPREVQDECSEVGNGDVEREGLLDRAPTMPSNQRLSHLPQNNKGSKTTQNDLVVDELRRSLLKRSSAENKNQDLSTSSSSPSPEKPPRSQDVPEEDKVQAEEDERGETDKETLERHPADSEKTNDAVPKQENKNQDLSTSSSPPAPDKPQSQDLPEEDKGQAEEDERGETDKETLERHPADSGKTNDAVPKQGSKIILSPSAPEKPPRLELADEDKLRESVLPDLEKIPTKINPPVCQKSARVKDFKPKASVNKPPEETKEVPDQNSDEKDKVTDSETSLPLSLVPEPQLPVLKSPVCKTSDPQPSVTEPPVLKSLVSETSGPQPSVPELPVPKTPVLNSSFYKPPVPTPRSRLSQAFPKNEHKEDPSSDQVDGKPEVKNCEESGLLGSGEKSERPTISSELTDTEKTHEPPVTETNQREETLLKNDKQVPEEKQKPDGEGDQKEIDPCFNTPKEPQSLELSKPDSSKADSSPDRVA